VEGASIRRVDVVNIDIKKCWHRFADALVADHDHRVADANLRGAIGLDVTSGVERPPQELDQTAGTLNDDARRDRVPASGNLRDHRCCLQRTRWAGCRRRLTTSDCQSMESRRATVLKESDTGLNGD